MPVVIIEVQNIAGAKAWGNIPASDLEDGNRSQQIIASENAIKLAM